MTITEPWSKESETVTRDITVMVLHGHQLLADGLRLGLDGHPDLEVAAVLADATDAMEIVRLVQPDVVLIDANLGAVGGLEAGRTLLEDAPDLKLILMTGYGNHDDLAAQAISGGFAGVLSKHDGIAETAKRIRAVHEGMPGFTNRDLARALCRVQPPELPSDDLTDREIEVLRLLAAGASSVVIAETLNISLHTVRSHVRNILRKLGAHAKIEALSIAYRRGLIAVPQPNGDVTSAR